ncbi:hypothetical protein [Streptomyces sp. CoT10]|uniref:hypothetical protein n=1 Tax=Streptomyces sp. CoT10 TaxID=2875762 RepID=UPI001CD78821|nr:hypothetical protein [Streptomyces sp. CoT10]
MGVHLFRIGQTPVRWPVGLVTTELTRLIDAAPTGGLSPMDPHLWGQEVEHFLREVFDAGSVEEWLALWSSDWEHDTPASDAETGWLRDLRTAIATMPEPRNRPAYWTQRRVGGLPQTLGTRESAAAVANAVADLEQAGYLVWAFGQACVEQPRAGVLGHDPADTVHSMLGRTGLWPIAVHHTTYTLDDLADVIEFLADHVRRPTRSYLHDYADCGRHFDGFDAIRGVQVYRARINAVLRLSDLGLELGENGRLVQTAPTGLGDLVTDALGGPPVYTADAAELTHAVERFRARDATDLDRRHAVIALAGILERRRHLVSEHLLQKDAGALFSIANTYGIRHQKADQRIAYDPHLYLEWIFYLYLGVINLTNRIVAEQQPTPGSDAE